LEIIRKISKPAAIFLAFHMLMLSGLYQSVSAAMISMESIINVDRGQSPRDYLNNLLAREEIRDGVALLRFANKRNVRSIFTFKKIISASPPVKFASLHIFETPMESYLQ
jgi:hypothetical protein